MRDETATLRAHGGRIDAAAALYPQAPRPWLDLSTGINPVGYPLPLLDPALWQRLPLRTEQDALVAAAAARYGRPRGVALIPLPGSEPAIRLIPALRPARRVVVLGPTYGSHAAAWAAAGATVVEVAGLDEVPADADALVAVNPNNPDGARHAPDDLVRRARTVGTLVVDEAFADVAPELSLLARPDLPANVVVLRSLGKFFGLAGLRLGFVAVAEADAARWHDLLGDWPVSGPACAVGAAALADAGWIAATRARLAADRARLDALVAAAGPTVRGGTDLFRYVEAGEGLFDRLARRGILVRAFDHAPARVRIGLPGRESDWRRLAAALDGFTGDGQAV